ncbi:MAG: hypothetical protein U0835_10490 [Isosphaeraceae bacterium]
MGLGSVSNRPGTFGEFRPAASGFRSVGVKEGRDASVAVPPGQTVELSVVSVCLNYGISTPTPRDKFELVDVEDYSADARVRKALRSLATFGTSQGVAQAAMWRVNNVPFEVMLEKDAKTLNTHEVSLAARFVDALDASGSSDLVDPAYLQEARLFVRVAGEGVAAKQAERIAEEIQGLRVMGLPVRVVAGTDDNRVNGSPGPAAERDPLRHPGRRDPRPGLIQQADANGQWARSARRPSSTARPCRCSTAGLARAIDRAVSSAYVTIKPARRAVGTTTFKVDNRLPFTVAKVTIHARRSSGSPTVELSGLGVAPARSGLVPSRPRTPRSRARRAERALRREGRRKSLRRDRTESGRKA